YRPSGGELTASDLSHYDMLVILSPIADYTTAEVTAVTDWIAAGGSLFIISDHYGASGVSQLNNLLSNMDLTHNMTHEGSAALVQTGFHPTHEGSTDMSGAAVGLIVASGDAVVTWNDDQGGPVIGADEYGNGRVILAADLAFFRDGRLSISDNLESFISMTNWLTSGNAKVLAFIDKNTIVDDPNDNQYKGPIAQALNDLGVSWYFTGEEQTWLYLNLSLHLYDWDLVVIDQFSTNLNFLWRPLLEYVKSGERLIYSSMQLNQLVNYAQAFRDYVGVKYPQGYITPTPTNYFWPGSSPILTSPRNYGASNVSVVESYGFPTCQNLTYHENGTALAGLSLTKPGTNSHATIVLGVGGDVLVNGVMVTGFDNDTDDSTYKDNFELWQNEIAFMLRPTVDSPTDMTIEVGSRTESIVWDAYSDRPDHYTIVRNSFEILNEPWDGGPITLPLEEDNLGTEEFHLTIFDELGFSAIDTVAVTKEDTTSPQFISVTENPGYEEGTVWYLVNWTFDEMFPDSFDFYIDEAYETGGSWDGSLISVNAGHLSPGVHNLTISVIDTSGNSASEMVYLTVTEVAPPDDGFLIIVIIAAMAVVVLIIVIIIMRKRS
ncbi:MAG: DUF4350 domain-containing protein, partial [Candidatus Thorarchaeota archaeon]